MFKKSLHSASGAGWVIPISQSIQACSPRVRHRRRVARASLVVLSLMQDLQLHRGLSCALLDGQHRFSHERAAVAEKLQRSLVAAAEQFNGVEPVFRTEPWRMLQARWDSLRSNWPGLDFHTNLSVHSELVMGLVAILGALAGTNGERLGERLTSVVAEWTAMAEHLGMLRAIGLHVLDRRDGLADPRICGLFKEHLHEARSTLASTADSLDDSVLLTRSHEAVACVIALRNGAVLEPQHYFGIMTPTIDDWYAAIRDQLNRAADFRRRHLSVGT